MTKTTPLASESMRSAELEMGVVSRQRLVPPISHAPSTYGVEPIWKRRRTITVNKPNKHQSPFLQPCLEWLSSPHGIASTVKLLTQYKLKVDAGEVANDVAQKLWIYLTRHPDAVIDNIRGYCYRALRNHIVDMLSGAQHAHIDDDDLADDTDVLSAILDTDGSETEPTHGYVELDDRLRAYVESSGKKPKVISAALTYLVLDRFRDIDCTDLKAPEAGARPDQARWWPCLWLAEHDETMFPNDGMDSKSSPAQRKKLQHAKDRAQTLLAMCASQMGDPR